MMNSRWIIVLALLAIANLARAETPNRFYFYTFETALASAEAKEVLNPAVKIYPALLPAPETGEKTLPDTFTGTQKNSRLFRRDEPRQVCMEVFASALNSMIVDAAHGGYDVVINIRGEVKGGPEYSNKGFDCDAGLQTTSVRLTAELGVTKAVAQVAEEIERDPAQWVTPKRTAPLVKNAIVLSLEDVLKSPEASAVLGPIKTHVGLHGAPPYSARWGPQEYSEDARIEGIGAEAACRKAVIQALGSIIEDMQEKKYDGIVKIRSFLNDQPASKDTDLECEVGRRSAAVNLQATMVKLK